MVTQTFLHTAPTGFIAIGYLSHAATVTSQGRTFLCSLFSILPRTLQPHHHLRLNLCARADLAWWNTFLQGWNGKSFFPGAKTTLEVTSDASGSYGCGAIFCNTWFQVMAAIMGSYQYHSKRAGPYRHRSSFVG